MRKLVLLAGVAMAGALAAGSAEAATYFKPGDLIVSVEGNGPQDPLQNYTDNQAAPLTLYQFSTTGTNQTTSKMLVLPQNASGSNYDVSGEYGSSSEGVIQLTGKGNQLTIMGYGVNAKTYNSDPAAYGGAVPALAQSRSVPGKGYTAIPRVVAVIGSNGSVNSSTALYNFADQNNPRSVYSVDGKTFYVSGQGNTPDATSGVFLAHLGSGTLTPITGADAGAGVGQDTRVVTIYDNTLYVSSDSKKGATNRDFVGTLGTPPATSLYNGGSGPTQLKGFGSSDGKGKVTISGNGNGLNNGLQINLSPDQFFFANPSTLYVADTGAPKNSSGTSPIGDGGLQKWVDVKGTWTLEYTLYQGLNLVENSTAKASDTSGTTGLAALTGELIDGGKEVELFATNYTIGDTDQTYLYGITDTLLNLTPPGASEAFTKLATAPADTTFKGVAFAPVPEPGAWALLIGGLAMMGGMLRTQAGRRRRAIAA